MRKEWKFSYTSATVCDAARAKEAHHIARLAWWQDQKNATMARIKDGGLQVEESMAPSNMSTAYSRGSTVTIRDDLNRDLQECVEKIREHDARAKEYNGWVQVLDNRGDRLWLELDHNDWLYFFGK
jgi:hypothetical protein